jgi:hypothetical protein
VAADGAPDGGGGDPAAEQAAADPGGPSQSTSEEVDPAATAPAGEDPRQRTRQRRGSRVQRGRRTTDNGGTVHALRRRAGRWRPGRPSLRSRGRRPADPLGSRRSVARGLVVVHGARARRRAGRPRRGRVDSRSGRNRGRRQRLDFARARRLRGGRAELRRDGAVCGLGRHDRQVRTPRARARRRGKRRRQARRRSGRGRARVVRRACATRSGCRRTRLST